MKIAPRVSACCLLAALAACQTTGDPRRGGLFGWSESEARNRQTEKRAEVKRADAELTREESRSAELDRRRDAETKRSRQARTDRQEALARVSAAEAEAREKLAALRDSSASAAVNSRIRSFQKEIDGIAENDVWSPDAKVGKLRGVKAEIESFMAEDAE